MVTNVPASHSSHLSFHSCLGSEVWEQRGGPAVSSAQGLPSPKSRSGLGGFLSVALRDDLLQSSFRLLARSNSVGTVGLRSFSCWLWAKAGLCAQGPPTFLIMLSGRCLSAVMGQIPPILGLSPPMPCFVSECSQSLLLLKGSCDLNAPTPIIEDPLPS